MARAGPGRHFLTVVWNANLIFCAGMVGACGMTTARIWKERLIGVWLAGTTAVLALGLFSHVFPSADPLLGTLARMTDSARVHLLGLAVILALGLAILGVRWIAAAVTVAAVVGFGFLAVDYRSRIAPVGERADLTILWYNVFKFNELDVNAFADGVRASGADMVILAEAEPAMDLPPLVADVYPHRMGCQNVDPEDCNLMVLSKEPLDAADMQPMSMGPERLARIRVETAEGPIDVIAAHMIKPWIVAMSLRDETTVWRAILRRDQVPYILVGDLNAAPWSARLRRMEKRHNLRHWRWPEPTWPVAMGPAGLPIDHVLASEGVAITDYVTWAGYGSNHMGIMASVQLQDRTE